MNTISALKNQNNAEKGGLKSSRILSGGDEKVLRLFEAPYNFVKTINELNPFLYRSSETNKFIFSTDHSNEEVEQMIESESKK